MTCKLASEEPSLISRKLKPPLLSRRVRIQPCTRTLLPIAACCRAALTEIFSMGASREPRMEHGSNTDSRGPEAGGESHAEARGAANLLGKRMRAKLRLDR